MDIQIIYIIIPIICQ